MNIFFKRLRSISFICCAFYRIYCNCHYFINCFYSTYFHVCCRLRIRSMYLILDNFPPSNFRCFACALFDQLPIIKSSVIFQFALFPFQKMFFSWPLTIRASNPFATADLKANVIIVVSYAPIISSYISSVREPLIFSFITSVD
jgi:hypothetical protein